MPKRIGYVYEELIDIENCNRAVLNAIKRKKKTAFLKHVRSNYKEYGAIVQRTLIDGWEPRPLRYKTINEGSKAKTRDLRIPPLIDHIIHTAVAQILEKYLAKRFYFFACGSLPDRGQTFAVKALEGNIRKKRPKYAVVADVYHCYASTKRKAVMYCLRRVFKDERFLQINDKILQQMGDGLAIGFTVSHWYEHLVLHTVDEQIKTNRRDVFLVRFMDNFVFTGNNKRKLHRLVSDLNGALARFGLTLKGDWQVFPIRCRMVEFLSYRLDYDKTILRKGLMYRMARRFRKARKHLNAHVARGIMSCRGILKHCDGYRFKREFLYPNVSIKLCRRLISDDDQKRILCAAA